MTNKETYKRAFSSLRSATDYMEGIRNMETIKHFRMPKALVACLVICLLLSSAGVCYAADVGGLRRQIQIWTDGDVTDAVIEFNGQGGYSLEYTDAEGNTRSRSGGGVVYERFGRERPATPKELMEELNAPDVCYLEDGTVMLYYYGQARDITELFEDGLCHITLMHEGEPLYMTIRYREGYSYSSFSYPKD